MKKLSHLNLDAPFFQAPLSGYTDQPMRLLARQFGAPLTFSGLMLDKSVLAPGVLEKPHYAVTDQEHPVGAQLLGNDPDVMAQAARRLCEYGYDLIDLNFACPAPKVTQKQRGGFLLTQPDIALMIIKQVRQAISCPLLLKLRIGYDQSAQSQENFWHICEKALAAEVNGLVIHGRTVQSRYRDRADWNFISQVKKRFPHAFITGSGDIFTAEDVAEKLAHYDIDAVLIARGAIGNPWIFRESLALTSHLPKPPPPSLTEQGQIMLRHLDMILRLYPPRKAVPLFRKFCVHYCKRHPRRKKTQSALLAAQNPDSLRSTIINCYGL